MNCMQFSETDQQVKLEFKDVSYFSAGGNVQAEIAEHNSAVDAHNDIRLLINGLASRLNALADSDDTTLDQMSEIVTYIKANKALIDAITVPTKVSQLTNDTGYLTSYTETDPTVPAWAKTPEKPEYTAQEVGARPDSWTPSAADVGADSVGTAVDMVALHNVALEAHNDIRLLIEGLANRLNALADSDDTTLDQMSEIVAYIKANKTLIESITTNKVNVSDIINNLTTNTSGKPLSAAQGVVLKSLIDGLSIRKLDVTAVSDWAKSATKPSYTKSEVGLSNVDNVKQYSASNPPPYPVTSVNGKTGAVTVAMPEIVQATGDSESAVMSQKAVTDALKEYEIPDYWQEYLDTKCSTIKALQDAGGKDCFSFIVITDVHYPSNLGKRSPALARYIMEQSGIKTVLVLGDVRNRGAYATKDLCEIEWANIEVMFQPLKDKYLLTQGNHDAGYGRGDYDGDGDEDTFVYEFTPAEMFERVYRKAGLAGNAVYDASGTAFYVDDSSNCVRYILLNTQLNFDGNKGYDSYETVDGMAKYPSMWKYRYTQCQYDFLTNDALATVPGDGWKVIIGSHIPINQTGEMPEHPVMIGVLNAFKNKSTYSGEYAGTAEGGANYTNLFDKTAIGFAENKGFGSSGGALSSREGHITTNYIPVKPGQTLHIRGLSVSGTSYGSFLRARGYVNSGDESYLGSLQMGSDYVSGVFGTSDYDETVLTYLAYTKADGTQNDAFASAAYIRISGLLSGTVDDVIITVNEKIVESVSGYDSVSISCDFTNAKGDLVAYHGGHSHADTASKTGYPSTALSFPIITTRCDAAQENDETLKAERVTGTTTEQCFDVFTVNTKTKTIQATRIGAGADRTISY